MIGNNGGRSLMQLIMIIINYYINKVYFQIKMCKNDQIVQLTVICMQGSHDDLKSTHYVKTMSNMCEHQFLTFCHC